MATTLELGAWIQEGIDLVLPQRCLQLHSRTILPDMVFRKAVLGYVMRKSHGHEDPAVISDMIERDTAGQIFTLDK